jgi:hypothetical protein
MCCLAPKRNENDFGLRIWGLLAGASGSAALREKEDLIADPGIEGAAANSRRADKECREPAKAASRHWTLCDGRLALLRGSRLRISNYLGKIQAFNQHAN